MPVGLACLPPVLIEHETEILDLFFEKNPEEALREKIRTTQPGLIGFSVRNVDNQLWARTEYYLPEVKRYVEVAREESRMPIVLGGAAYSIFPYTALKYIGADWGIVGDGEVIFPRFVKALENCCDPSSIEGVVNPKSGGKRFKPPRVEDYDNTPIPQYDAIRFEDYISEGSALSIISRRGCPYNCIYCDAPVSEGHELRGKSPKRLVDEIETVARMGAKTVNVSDNVFNYPRGYAREVAEEIIRRDLKIAWGATLHPSGADENDLRIMRKSGMVVASIGPDTGSPDMMKNLNKGCDLDQVKRLVKMLKENEIGFFMSILLGGPGETRQSVEKSVDLITKTRANVTGVRVGIRITPLTKLHEIAVKQGVVEADNKLMEPRFYITDEVKDWVFDYLNNNLKGMPGINIQ